MSFRRRAEEEEPLVVEGVLRLSQPIGRRVVLLLSRTPAYPHWEIKRPLGYALDGSELKILS